VRTEITASAKKDLAALPPPDRERVLKALAAFQFRPESAGLKKLRTGGSPKWRLRVGVFRVILDIDTKEGIIYVLRVGHRKDVYRFLKNP
jgi:mRNA interferase RelE/StbE